MNAVTSRVKELAKYARPRAQMFMRTTKLRETQKRDLDILKSTRKSPTEGRGDTQSENNRLIIDKPLEPTSVNEKQENGEHINYKQL